MAEYVYVGGFPPTDVDGGRIKLERFGQRIEIEDELAATVIAGGGAILPAGQFDEFEFSESDLKRYGTPAQRATATDEFSEKFRAAQAAYCELRAEQEEGK